MAFSCQHCANMEFESEAAYQEHNEAKDHKVCECGQTFAQNVFLKWHRWTAGHFYSMSLEDWEALEEKAAKVDAAKESVKKGQPKSDQKSTADKETQTQWDDEEDRNAGDKKAGAKAADKDFVKCKAFFM